AAEEKRQLRTRAGFFDLRFAPRDRRSTVNVDPRGSGATRRTTSQRPRRCTWEARRRCGNARKRSASGRRKRSRKPPRSTGDAAQATRKARKPAARKWLEGDSELRDGREPTRGCLRETARDHLLEPFWHVRAHDPERRLGLHQNDSDELRHRLGVE